MSNSLTFRCFALIMSFPASLPTLTVSFLQASCSWLTHTNLQWTLMITLLLYWLTWQIRHLWSSEFSTDTDTDISSAGCSTQRNRACWSGLAHQLHAHKPTLHTPHTPSHCTQTLLNVYKRNLALKEDISLLHHTGSGTHSHLWVGLGLGLCRILCRRASWP